MGREFKPDTGWAWVVLAAGFLSSLIFDGIIFSFGIILSDLAEYFEVGLGDAAWIGATISAVYGFVGPIASVLANRFGCRVVTIVGAVTSAVGFIASSFSTHIWVMVLTYGVIGGVGFGMMYHCAYVMLGFYFEKYRALATGITACGSGVGMFVFGQLSNTMLNTFGWKGSMWLFAGITLQGAVVGMCYRPVPNMGVIVREGQPPKRKLLSLSLLKNPAFIIMCFSSFLCLIGFYIPFMYLPNYAIQDGASTREASMLISIIGITNTIGRILCGWICDKSWADPLKIYNAALIIAGSSTVGCAWLSMYALKATYAAVFGFCIACYVSLCAIILVEFLGLERLSNAFGFLNMFRGLATVVGAPIAGILYDQTGRFDLTFYVAGTSIAAAGVICLPLRLLSQCATGENIASEKNISPSHSQSSPSHGKNKSEYYKRIFRIEDGDHLSMQLQNGETCEYKTCEKLGEMESNGSIPSIEVSISGEELCLDSCPRLQDITVMQDSTEDIYFHGSESKC